ncbi:MAG TPA: hypothetical protein VFW65_13980 [Pseudonocardiaceae bacterium]|nr:hypothetical protein [Pseudonocardiaceae bacterium]
MDDDPDDEATSARTYRHDPAQVAVLAQLADRACDGVTDIHDAGTRIPAIAAETASPVASAATAQLVNLFSYTLSVEAIAGQPGATLEPLDGPSFYPLALRDAGSDIRALWAGLASQVAHPIARARCHDIVFTLRLGQNNRNNRDHAEHAVGAYLDAVGGSLRRREQSYGLVRAWTLTRSVGLNSLEPQVITAMMDMAELVINQTEDPHAALPLLAALTAWRPKATRPTNPRAHALLDQGLTTYSQSRIISEFATLIRARAADDPPRVEHASRVEVGAFLADAETSTDGLVVRARLNEAASLARKLGIKDLEQQATARLQAAPPVEWTTFTSPDIELPEFYVRTFLHPFRHASTWREALAAWFATDCPTGRYENNKVIAQGNLGQSVMWRLATRVVFDENDLPRRVTVSEADALDEELVRVETHSMGTVGLILGKALDLIAARFGIPSQKDLAQFITSSGTRPAFAETLATSLRLYWVREYTASVHLAAPEVEAATRALLLELNEPVYRTAVGNSTGQFPGLGALLPSLVDNGFDPDWERFLRTLLLSDGSNVRNRVAHGFMDDVDWNTAALVLRACALMVLITGSDAAGRDHAAVKTALARPTPRPRQRSPWRRWANALRAAYLEVRRP